MRKIARGRAGVLAKIEKPQAVERLAAIIEHADALMVARGDLGVEMPLERVPGIQKQITRAARRAGKPVVVATQMLESMITAPVPTRAEVSDVATAVFEGADAIMLSAESAAGAYPVEAVATMDRIASEVERDPNYVTILRAQRTEPEATGADAISAAARQIAETLNLAAICCYTASGTTAMRAARERPQHADPRAVAGRRHRAPPVAGLGAALRRRRGADDLDDMVEPRLRSRRTDEGFAEPGERIIITAGVPLGTPGATNMLRIAYVRRPDSRRASRAARPDIRFPCRACPRAAAGRPARRRRLRIDRQRRLERRDRPSSLPRSCRIMPRPGERAEVARLKRQRAARCRRATVVDPVDAISQ